MDGAELFTKCLAQATVVVKQVRPEQLTNATPCADWHVGDLLDYLLAELDALPKLLAGETIALTPGDDEDDSDSVVNETAIDLSTNWQSVADTAEAASASADPDELAHLSTGDVTNDVYLRQIAVDLLIHAWDLAVAIGMPFALAPDVALVAYDHVLSPDGARQPDYVVAAPLGVDSGASAQVKLLALYGRSLDWHAAG